MTRPRGMPPTPMHASSESEVVEMAGMSMTSLSPRRMIDPLPNFFSMFSSAASTALPRSALALSSAMTNISFFHSFSQAFLLSRAFLRPVGHHNESEYNTSAARMEQRFTRATHFFSSREGISGKGFLPESQRPQSLRRIGS